MRYWGWMAAGLVLAGAWSVTTTATEIGLPRGVWPSHYDLAITPHASTLSFDGKVGIDVTVRQPTGTITLNALQLHFRSAAVLPAAGGQSLLAKVSVDEPAQTATLHLAHILAPGRYRLELDYQGKINTQAQGLFAIDYANASGRHRALYTQFESSDARRLIPSWDQPDAKASFTLTVISPAKELTVSNMPQASREPVGHGQVRVRFQTTPKMSSYLLFFGQGDFTRVTVPQGKTELGVVTQQGTQAQAQFALTSAKAILGYYNDYFGIPYPLPKLDNIAAPGSSQGFSAMENWGAIFTFEYAMLLDPANATPRDQQGIFSTLAHEMAHQWFGDLVTMRWWNDLWLNESFASWMESRATAKLHPEWQTRLSAVTVRDAAMQRDAVATTHPIVQPVANVAEAGQAFDNITYLKGESVISMLEGYLGEQTWRDAIRGYLKAHAYGNAVSDDLWAAMETATKQPIKAIAHDFILQPGVPQIRLDSAVCQAGYTLVKLSQGEFSRDEPHKMPLRWHVPALVQVLGQPIPVQALVTDGQASLSLPGCGAVLINAGAMGYYRSLYPAAQWQALAARFATLSPADQLNLLDDGWALGLAGRQSFSDYLDLTARVPLTARPQVWAEVAQDLVSVDNYYEGLGLRQARWRQYAMGRLQPLLQRLGWQPAANEPAPVIALRNTVIGSLGILGDQQVIAKVRALYAAQAKNPEAVAVSLRKTVQQLVAETADATTWNQLRAKARTEVVPLRKDRLYQNLSLVKDPTLAKQALRLALSEEPGATNSANMIRGVSMQHPELAFDFALAHREAVLGKLSQDVAQRFFPSLAQSSNDPAMIAKLESYAKTYASADSHRATDTFIAGIRYHGRLRASQLPVVDSWLAKQQKS